MIVLLVFSLFSLYILNVLWSRRKIYWLHEKLKNETWALPLLGNCLQMIGDDEDRMKMLIRFGRISVRQGGLTSLWLGSKFCVVVTDAEIAEILLKTFLEKDDLMNIAHDLFGNGSIFAPVPIWRPRRKIIAPTFSFKNLNQFVEVFYRQSNIMVEQLKDVAGKGTFSVWKYLTTYTMDSVCETALGVDVNAQRQPDHPFLEAFEQHCLMGAARILLPPFVQQAYKYFPIYKTYMKPIHTMWSFVDDIIITKQKKMAEDAMKILQCNKDNPKDTHKDNNLTKYTKENFLNQQKTFLELFIESSGGSSGFTNIELREETLVILLAGTDTSAVGSAFTCIMLARHPEVQEKVYDELKEVLDNHNSPITPTDLPNLKYLEAVVKESLRLYPPVPIIFRNAEKDLELPSGLTIVKGTALLFNIWATHRNPRYWGEDAEEFKPDRFIGSTFSHPAAFMPFSYGSRSCLGYQYAMMSMKTAVANLVRHYRIHPAYPVQDNNAPLRVKFDVMMKHVDNFELQLEARS